MAFGIQDLENDVQKFQQDIENAKAKYMDEYAEYVNIATDFENVAQKYDFLHEGVEAIARVFPEEREETDSAISDSAKGLLISGGVFLTVAGISYMVRRFNLWKATQFSAIIEEFEAAARAANANPQLTGKAQRLLLGNLDDLDGAARAATISKTARTAKAARATKIAAFTVGVGAILGIVGVALAITSARQQKEYLEEQKAELKKHLDDVNGYIAEANDDTKNIIDAFLIYFDAFEIDVNGVFNDNQDGFLDESGQQKFDDPENGVVSQLREALNGATKRMGELNASINFSNSLVDFFISDGLEGKELIEKAVNFTELPEEVIQRLYVFKLRELGSIVQKAIELSKLPEDLVKKLYARGYLDDGKTVEDTVELSGLTEDQVRRVYASKLLDDRLKTENPDDVLDIKGIAEQAGLSEDIVLEIQVLKIAADLPSSSEEEES